MYSSHTLNRRVKIASKSSHPPRMQRCFESAPPLGHKRHKKGSDQIYDLDMILFIYDFVFINCISIHLILIQAHMIALRWQYWIVKAWVYGILRNI
jgi:hypothetical protein